MSQRSDTYQRVFEVADDILMSGKRPTQQNIRAILGTGSATTIHKALGDWWLTLGKRINDEQEHSGVPEPVVKACRVLWNTSLDHAKHAHEEWERRLSEREKQLADKEKSLVHAQRQGIDELQRKMDQAYRQQLESVEKNSQLAQELLAAERQLIEKTARVTALEREVKQYSTGKIKADTDDKLAEISEYKSQLKTQAKTIKSLESALKKAESSAYTQGELKLKRASELEVENRNLHQVISNQDAKLSEQADSIRQLDKKIKLLHDQQERT